MKPKLTAVLIAACACTASVAGGDGDASPPSCVPRAGEADWWAPKHEAQFAMAKERGEAIKVAVLGDSLAAFWTAEGKKAWQEQWVPRGAACFGIPADRTEHVLWRIEQGLFDLIDPRVVVLQVGTNNLKSGEVRRSPEETAAGVRAIAEAIRKAEPDARVIVLAVLPRQPKYEWIDEAIRETNVRLCALQREMDNVFVVDLGAHFRCADLKPCRVHLKDDMLHLKASSYELITQSVIDLVDGGLDGVDRDEFKDDEQ